MRKVITPQRDMFAALASGVVELPSMTEEGQRYFRDIYDHLIRIADVVDGYRDLLSGVMDTHVSTVSNRLNVRDEAADHHRHRSSCPSAT